MLGRTVDRMWSSSAFMRNLLAVEVWTRRWQAELVISWFRRSGENPLLIFNGMIDIYITGGKVNEIGIMIWVLDYSSMIPVACHPICSGSIRYSSTAAHNGLTDFVCTRIVNAIHIVSKIGNILQLLIWSWNQSNGLQLVILFDRSSLVFDDSHVCGSVHRLIYYALFPRRFIFATSTTRVLLNEIRHFWTLKLHLTLVFREFAGTSVHTATIIGVSHTRVRSTDLLDFRGWNLFLAWNWRALAGVLESSTPWIHLVLLSYSISIRTSSSRRTSKITTYWS